MSEPEALAAFHRWADNRRHRSTAEVVTSLARLWLAWALLWISDAASWLARKAVPTP